MEKSALPISARALLVLIWSAIGLLCFAYYSFFIIRHFEIGGYVLDSGWFAYLTTSGDPLLTNPRSVNNLSYYAHHVSPILYLWSVIFGLGLQLSAITSFALLIGLAALITLAPFAAVSLGADRPRRHAYLAALVALVFTLTNTPLIRTLSYPHFEILIPGLVGILFLCLVRRRLLPALAVMITMALVREDGGLFAAYTITVHWALNVRFANRSSLGRCAVLFALALSLSVAPMVIQHVWFPGFETFSSNFSGNGFDHLTVSFLIERIGALFTNRSTAPTLLVCVFLAIRAPRFVVPLALMTPLIGLQLISVRDVIGHFELHYGIPFAVVMMLMLILFLMNPGSPRKRPGLWAAMAVLLAVNQAPTGFWINWMTELPQFTVWESKRLVDSHTPGSEHRTCGSIGAVALAPDRFDPGQFIKHGIPDDCEKVILFAGDLDYDSLRPLIDRGSFRELDRAHRLVVFTRGEKP